MMDTMLVIGEITGINLSGGVGKEIILFLSFDVAELPS